MYHVLNGLPFTGKSALDSLGINYIDPFNGVPYALTYPFNSSEPTRVWGFEVEHQTNLGFLPGLLKNFVLNYNLSVVRSETFIPTSKTSTIDVIVPGIPFPIKKIVYSIEQKKQKLEGQPEFFGNFAVGYDVGGFSARLSVFHQGEYNRTFSPDGKSDTVVDRFTRWDFVLKQEIFKNASVLLNVNNFTNVEEGSSNLNRVQGWYLLNTSEVYGLTGDLGLRLTF
jgi:outer membrane receptor protein involved in Fe transport